MGQVLMNVSADDNTAFMCFVECSTLFLVNVICLNNYILVYQRPTRGFVRLDLMLYCSQIISTKSFHKLLQPINKVVVFITQRTQHGRQREPAKRSTETKYLNTWLRILRSYKVICISHFPPNSRDITCSVAVLNSVFCLINRAEKLKY